MIDTDGSIRCDGCGKKLAFGLKGELKIVCPRCKRYNVFVVPLLVCGTCFSSKLDKVRV